jgi:hypothetical protein
MSDTGIILPPKLQEMVKNGDLLKTKKSMISYIWDNCMSKPMRDLMKELMKFIESNISVDNIHESDNVEDHDHENAVDDDALSSKPTTMVNFNDSD